MSEENTRLLPLKINFLNCRREYVAGEYFDTTGLSVYYASGGGYVQVYDYTYSPNGPLTTSDTSITISYNGLTGTVPITVASGIPSSLIITPKTGADLAYIYGDTLNCNGYDVKVNYQGDVQLTKTFSQCSITYSSNTGHLVYGSNTVYISYTENNITVSTSLVINASYLPSLDLSKSSLSNHGSWFLADLNYLHHIPLINYNETGHPLSCFITYNINTPLFIKEMNSFLPSGCFLSLQQRIVLDNSTYKYIDEQGITHVFTSKTINSQTIYYSETTPTLVLEYISSSQTYELTDIKGDLYSFDSDGYLISIRYNGSLTGTQTTSDLLTLIIERNNDHSVNKVYYSNDVNTYLQFTYMYGTLTYFRVYQNSSFVRMISFSRSNGFLTGISSSNSYNYSSNIQILYSFTYGNDGLMASKTDELNHLITQYEYSLTHIKYGKDRYQLRKLTVDDKEYIFSSGSIDDSISSYLYQRVNILEKNTLEQSGPIFAHFLNQYLEYASKYEINDNYLLDLNKHDGIELTTSIAGTTKGVNHKYAFAVSSSFSFNIDNTTVNSLASELDVNKKKIYYNYSFYLKLPKLYSKVWAKVYINDALNALEEVEVDSSLFGIYQKVTIPFIYNSDITSLKIVLAYYNEDNTLSELTDAYISDPCLFFGSKATNLLGTFDLINQRGVYVVGYSIYRYSFTVNDILLSMQEANYKSSNAIKFLYLNNGRVVIPYIDISTVSIYTRSGTSEYLSSLLSNGLTQKIENKQCKHGSISVKTITSTTKCTYNSNHERTIEKENKITASGNTKKINHFEYYDKYGNKIKKKDISLSDSSHFVWTIYEYNQFNELVNSYKENASQELMPLQTIAYGSDGNVSSISSPFKTINYTYNAHKDIAQIKKGTATDDIHQNRSYDNYFRESSSSFYKKENSVDTLISSDSLTYDNKNEILTVNTNHHIFSYSNNYKSSYYSINNNTNNRIDTISSYDSFETRWVNGNQTKTYVESYNARGFITEWTFESYSAGYCFDYELTSNVKESPSTSLITLISGFNSTSGNSLEFEYYSHSSLLKQQYKEFDYDPYFTKINHFDGTVSYQLFSDTNYINVSPYYESGEENEGLYVENKYNGSVLKRHTFTYSYDSFLRISNKKSIVLSDDTYQAYNYGYLIVNGNTTNLISSFTYFVYIDIPPLDPATSFSVGESISYDSNYNISSIVDTISNDGSVSATITHSYTYDEFNRILSFSNGNNGRVTYYEYDEDKLSSIDEQYTTIVNGVSTLVHRYVNLSYNTYKQLTSFAVNDNGITQTHLFTYDAFGNRYSKSINGVPKESYTFSHNQLMGLNIYEGSSTNHLDFFYDYQGIRIKKEYTLANNTKQVTYYAYDDDKLLGIKVNMMTGTAISHSYQLSFLYDLEGVIGFIYCEDNSSTKERYVFVKNILGDILYISEEDGTPFISYQYSDYGEESHSLVNASSLSDAVIEKYNRIASINPFRYRSYVYDEESKLYYLFARYYDPFTHTFISLDSPKYLDINTLEGTYLYCYCGYNPIMRVDPTGENWWDDLWKNVGGWIKTNWKELSIGIGMILLGSLTMGIGALVAGSGLMTSIVAAGVSFVQSSIQSLISGVFSGIIHGIISNSAGESFSKGFFSGLASGFMWGGIVSGVSNIIGGALTLTRALNPHFKFLGSNSFRLWSPNSLSNKHLGGTILNVKNIIRLDVDTVWRGLGLHLHIGISDFHLPAAWLIGILLDYDD